MSFLSVSGKISFAGAFFLFFAISSLAIIFVFTIVPETKGKSLEQIEMMFQNENESRVKEMELEDVEQLVQNKTGLTN
ncbi:unnamed protein product [Lathyrus sativus]|nr:unnamed protein product [Lathyrus sativus]